MATGLEPNVTGSGDEIVFEGVRNFTRVIRFLAIMHVFMIIASCGLFLLFLPCAMFFFYINLFTEWKLFITHTELQHGVGFGYIIVQDPLSDIEQISVIPGSNIIHINWKHPSGPYGRRQMVIDSVRNISKFVAPVSCEERNIQCSRTINALWTVRLLCSCL